MEYGNPDYSLLIPKTQDNRVLFLTPWQNSLIIGTTDQVHPKAELDPTVSYDNLLYLLKELNKYFKNIPVDAIKSKWCGLRPLV